jgi:hypothetical protein
MKKMIIVAVLGYLAYWIYENKWSYSESSLEIQAKAMNQTLPKKMSPELTLLSVETKPGKMMVYRVQFFMDAKYLPPNAGDNLNTPALRNEVSKALCTEKVVRKGMQRGATIIYAFESRDGQPITEISFTDKDCQ